MNIQTFSALISSHFSTLRMLDVDVLRFSRALPVHNRMTVHFTARERPCWGKRRLQEKQRIDVSYIVDHPTTMCSYRSVVEHARSKFDLPSKHSQQHFEQLRHLTWKRQFRHPVSDPGETAMAHQLSFSYPESITNPPAAVISCSSSP